jgi:protein associated with RNAse G/E
MQELYHEIDLDFRNILSSYKWGLTPEIKKELIYYNVIDFVPINDGILIPITEKELEKLSTKYPTVLEFDIADQTALVVAQRENAIILTDDGSLLLEAQALNLISFRLPIFAMNQIGQKLLDKKEFLQALRFWEKTGRYSIKLIKKCKQLLNSL